MRDVQNMLEYLSRSLPVQERVSDKALRICFHYKLHEECIVEMLRMFRLKIRLRTRIKREENCTENTPPAAIYIPDNIPLYPLLEGYQLEMQCRELILSSYEMFVLNMSHELSHVVLYSLYHPYKCSEVATDLTSMLLGFSDIIYNGRKFCCNGNIYRYGYLSDEEFEFAYWWIKHLFFSKNR